MAGYRYQERWRSRLLDGLMFNTWNTAALNGSMRMACRHPDQNIQHSSVTRATNCGVRSKLERGEPDEVLNSLLGDILQNFRHSNPCALRLWTIKED